MQCRITLESRANSVAMKMHWLGRESVATASTIYFLSPDAVQFHRRMETKELDVTILLAKRLAMDLLERRTQPSEAGSLQFPLTVRIAHEGSGRTVSGATVEWEAPDGSTGRRRSHSSSSSSRWCGRSA